MSENSLPSTWRLTELKNVAAFVSGGTPSRKKPDYFTGSIPWLTGYDLPGITPNSPEQSSSGLFPFNLDTAALRQ